MIASDGEGWEHISINREGCVPHWDEMCFFKRMFWGEEDLVIQLHPPEKDYINNNNTVLHLWRKSGTNDFCEMPPKIMV